MTQEEIALFRKELDELKEKLKDLAGRYRMQRSGAFIEVMEIVDGLSDYTDSQMDSGSEKDV